MKLLAKLIYIVLTIIETTIAARIVLKLLNSPDYTPLTRIVYRYSDLFLSPLAGLGSPAYFEGIYIDINAIIGLFFYLIIMLVVVEIIKALSL